MSLWRYQPPSGQPAIFPSRGVIAAAFAVLLLALSLPGFAQSLPTLTGRVVDDAGIIDVQTETLLTARLAAFEKKSSDQIVVATVKDLGGEAIEPYANRLFRAWGLGQAGEDNGVLLLVALDDRKMRIEVGYGLEGTLTDLHSKLIIENTMVPAFRAGDFSGGISRAVDDIVTVLEGNGAELEARAERNQPGIDWDTLIPIAFIVLWCVIFFGAFGLAFLATRFGTKVGRKKYRWLGMTWDYGSSGRASSSSWGGSSWSAGSGGGGFSGGGGSSGGGGASGGW